MLSPYNEGFLEVGVLKYKPRVLVLHDLHYYKLVCSVGCPFVADKGEDPHSWPLAHRR
jgi:hypothetical protein